MIITSIYFRGFTDKKDVYCYILKEWKQCLQNQSLKDQVGTEMQWSLLALLCRNNGVSLADVCVCVCLSVLHEPKHSATEQSLVTKRNMFEKVSAFKTFSVAGGDRLGNGFAVTVHEPTPAFCSTAV